MIMLNVDIILGKGVFAIYGIVVVAKDQWPNFISSSAEQCYTSHTSNIRPPYERSQNGFVLLWSDRGFMGVI